MVRHYKNISIYKYIRPFKGSVPKPQTQCQSYWCFLQLVRHMAKKHWIMSQTIKIQSIVHFNIKRLNVMPWMSEVIHILRNTPQIVYSEREKVDINQKNSIYGYHSILHTMGVFFSFIHAKMTCITFPYIGQSAPIKLPSQKQGDIFCR